MAATFLTWMLTAETGAAAEAVAATGARAAAGVLLAWRHGWHKLADGLAARRESGRPWAFEEEVRAAGFPGARLSAWLATAVQLGGGLALLLGLFTRPAALLLGATLLGALWTNQVLRKDNQLALLYLVLLGVVFCLGGGPWSIDARLFVP